MSFHFFSTPVLFLNFLYFVLIYMIFNLFYYFVNIYKFNNWTSSTKEFWKRAFFLFWIIESFLFLIYIYIWLISPSEINYFFILKDLHMYNFSFSHYFNNNSLLIILSLLSVFSICILRFTSKKLLYLFYFVLIFFLIFILFNEFKVFFD